MLYESSFIRFVFIDIGKLNLFIHVLIKWLALDLHAKTGLVHSIALILYNLGRKWSLKEHIRAAS